MKLISLLLTPLLLMSAIATTQEAQPVQRTVYENVRGEIQKKQDTQFDYDKEGHLVYAVTTNFNSEVPYETVIDKFESTGRQIGLPDDVRDSLGQYIPSNDLWDSTVMSYSLAEVEISEERDTEGRITQINRDLKDGDQHWRYTYEYDDDGRFSSFCYERVLEQNGKPITSPRSRYKGSFTYLPDGGRDCVEEIRCEDIWTVGTFHYDKEGKLISMDGRTLLYTPGAKIHVDYHYLNSEPVATYLLKDGSVSVGYNYWNWLPRTGTEQLSHIPDPADYGNGVPEYDAEGRVIKVTYYNYKGDTINKVIEYRYA